ncbi:cell wall-binding repeat-containing protein [Catenulispora sp. NL8]|uniref:Cell wall-binding repeat-containing protein n=1 Tax=Catenulispora pinistramenti TaxID=2705254 RepID=A0ABS5KJJ7_9ACTN|nr:cell wall-binding repeat-containing protein [Catenulispora pinistramenti]MBS2546328.1 cell wall-binding repeat-containing protein [Catenulispora pinistramenti]
MRSSSFRKSLAATAVLASSVASIVGFGAAAHATYQGPANSPLTLDMGSFAPDGSRYVYADGSGAIITHNTPGGAPLVVDPAKPGVSRSHPTFFDNGAAIVFSETVNGVSKLAAIPTYTPAGDPVKETDPLSFLASKMPEGTETAPDSDGQDLVFQHHNATTDQDEIWVQDSFGRGSGGPILAATDGTWPTISPDGKTIAFDRKDSAGHEQIWTVAWNGQDSQTPAGTPKQITNDARDHLFPAFSPDGTRIAYEGRTATNGVPDDVESIAANGGGQRQESSKPGLPDYQPLNKDTITRLAGADRIGTAVATSQAKWPAAAKAGNGTAASSVVLSRDDQFADALGGSTLAVTGNGPLLLTPTNSLDSSVKAEIARVLGSASSSKTVYVLGGEQALSPAVYNAVKSMGYTVKRIAGPDRYATSVAIAETVSGLVGGSGWTQPDRVLVATGNNAPDALSAGAAAEAIPGGTPGAGVVVLTDDKKMPASTAAYLAQVQAHDKTDYQAPVYGVGGQGDAALTSVGIQHTALVGATRYDTSYLVAKTFFDSWSGAWGMSPAAVGFATGLTWPDALSGGAFMGQNRGPLLLVDPVSGISPVEQQWLAGWAPYANNAYIFGGTKAVDQFAQDNYATLIGGQLAGMNTKYNPKA